MSNLAKLKDAVFGYLQVDFPGVERHALLNNSTSTDITATLNSLFIQAANNARRRAELRHDFQCAEVVLTGTIPTDGTGLSWDEMVDELEVARTLRTIKTTYVTNEDTGDLIPVSVHKKSLQAKKRFDRGQVRIPTSLREGDVDARIVHWARKFYCDPANDEAIDLTIEGYADSVEYDYEDYQRIVLTVTGTLTTDGATPVVVPITMYEIEEEDLGNLRYSSNGSSDSPIAQPIPADGTWYTIERVLNLASPQQYAWQFKIRVYSGLALASTKSWTSSFYFEDALPSPAAATGWAPSGTNTGTPVFTASNVFEEGLLSSTTDYFLTRGFNYMMWATICEMNHLLRRFVPRQEGGLNPPTQERDNALEELIRDDAHAVESGNYMNVRDE